MCADVMADTEAEGDRKKAIDGIINRSEREPSVGIVFATHGPGTKPEIKPPAPLCVLPTDWSSNTLALSDRLVTKKECTVLLRLRSGTVRLNGRGRACTARSAGTVPTVPGNPETAEHLFTETSSSPNAPSLHPPGAFSVTLSPTATSIGYFA
ncbi:hypothetical protein SCAR479_04534 [Seiridium cardinale]|uniref:Uncharacterized protein n=1 Tax=Seiridium cardinale TaxID=138064 RepID=A0ABR2XXN2_9PEZI